MSAPGLEPLGLIDRARSLGVELSAAQAARLIAHLDLLDEWNQRMNLTAIREREAQITKHILDSLTVRPWLRGRRIADVGSGPGFPGVPLAIVEPERHFVLLESVGKKCRFLEQVRDALALGNLEVVQARAESFHPAERFETVIARAVGPLADLVRFAGPLLATGGRLLAMKGRYPEEELAAKLNGWKVVGTHVLHVPGLDEQRHLVELCRSHARSG
ncbi:MAG TPA: 16S rRNA (guanine(527)-N(7))-methyltransferase RsmG [Steroidobacteraceae bacterium]|nr:16S rRNA (guanine(527)-N(7))-methyltransferase RsmG [Steroidobacteraceae bacterium]